MKLEDISYRWIAPIHRYEKKFVGGLLGATHFLSIGIVGLILFGSVSQLVNGLVGIVVAFICAVVGVGVTLLLITPLPIFHNMTVVVYAWRRWEVEQRGELLRPTLSLLTHREEAYEIAIVDEENRVVSAVESRIGRYEERGRSG